MASNNPSSDFLKWVMAETLNKENVEKYELQFAGEGSKEHYGSDIVFVDVVGENRDGKKREYSLIIKYGQFEQEIREKYPIRQAFEVEIEIYSKVIPRYKKFQSEKGLPLIGFTANCFLTKFTETREAIVLDNLKTLGFSVPDKTLPLDLNHTKLVLDAFAEWHALSFALKDQYEEEFLEISRKVTGEPWRNMLKGGFAKLANFGLISLYATLEEHGELELLNKLRDKFGNKSSAQILLDLMKQVDDQSVIVHGDCWSGNFMFKYEEENPIEVKLLDFQMSSVRSPVVDVCHLIFAGSSGKELQHLGQLVHHYYLNLSNHLRKLGSDPQDLYPFESLKSDWKKYSAHGFLIGLMVAFFLFLPKDTFIDLNKEEELLRFLPKVTSNSQYLERVKDVTKYFVEFEI